MISASFCINNSYHLSDLLEKHNLVMTGSAKNIIYLNGIYERSSLAAEHVTEMREAGIKIALTKITVLGAD